MKHTPLALWAAVAAFATTTAWSAEIAWSVFNITGEVTDVSTKGTLVDARAGADSGSTYDVVDGGTFEINGVTFDDDLTIDNPSHSDTINARCGVPGAGANASYNELLRHSDRQREGDAAITFTGLNIGHTYQIQIWSSDNANDTPTDEGVVLGNGTDTAPNPNTAGHAILLIEPVEGGPGQYALGTFTADATSLSFALRCWKGLTATPAPTYNTMVNAVQLRDLGPSSPGGVTPSSSGQQRDIEITRRLYDKKSDRYYLEWASNQGDTYGVYLIENAGAIRTCIAASITGTPEKTTFGPFANPRPGNSQLLFEIGAPDLTPPSCLRAWGNGKTVSLHFSEPMKQEPALDPANYSIAMNSGHTVPVVAAEFHPGSDTVVLTTAQPLELTSRYTVTMRRLTDAADIPLGDPQVSFHTWDDNPNGVKVFILAGQSNMVGHGWYDKGQGGRVGGTGSLREQVLKYPQNLGHLIDKNQKWRELVGTMFWWNRADPGTSPRILKGNMTVGYGAGPDCIGPEYGFGWVVQKSYPLSPVLIIKTAWANKSLHIDYCSPSAAAQRNGRVGPYYEEMMKQIHQVLENLDRELPLLQGLGYQICGFGWHHGYIDMLGEVTSNAYEDNLAMLIRDIRAELGKPQLPFCIATTGHGGVSVSPDDRPTLAGQLAVADPAKYPEFAGNVFAVDTRPFYRDASTSPGKDAGLWNQNGHTLYLIGQEMGNGMVKMLPKP